MGDRVQVSLVIDLILGQLAKNLADLGESELDMQATLDIYQIANEATVILEDIKSQAQVKLQAYLDQSGQDKIILDGDEFGYEDIQEEVVDQSIWEKVCKKNVTAKDADRQYKQAEARLKKFQEKYVARFTRSYKKEFYIKIKKVL